MFLLSGDAIVNESMLTGESVPVSKTPASDNLLTGWRMSPDVGREASASFLYAGTRVVRVRSALAADGSPGSPALAIVTRGGQKSQFAPLTKPSLPVSTLRFPYYQRCIGPKHAFP
jgi:cation-transporting P-type ATPase 13A2